MEQAYHLIVRRSKSILFLILLLTGFFAYHAQHIRLDSSVESLLPRDDPDKQYYQEVRQLFGDDEMGVIGLVTDDIYTPEVLRKIKRLTEEIKKVDGVEDVRSLTNAPDIIARVAGDEQALLVPDIPATTTAWEELKKKLADTPIYLKNLVSPDGRAAAINISFRDSLSDDEFLRRGIDDTIQAIVDRENGPEQLYYTGAPHFKAYLTKSMREDLTRIMPLTLLLVVVVLFLSFRSLRGVLLPALTVIVSLIWTLGIMVLAGNRLSLGSIALPPLLLVLGTAYSLHVVAEYYELAVPGRPVSEVVLETLRQTSTPVFIAAMTTVLGFLSLVVNRIISIKEMGIYSSVGITLAFVLSIVLVPALLALLPPPTRREATYSPALSATLQRLARISIRHRGAVIVIGIFISLLSAWQLPSIRADSNFQSFFREDDPIRQATNAIDHHLAGGTAFHVVIDGKGPDSVSTWDALREIKDLQLYIDSLPGVHKTVSFVDYCEILDRALQELLPEGENAEVLQPQEKTSFWDNPSQLDGLMQLVFLIPNTVSGVVNHPNYSRANILVRTSLYRASDVLATVDKIQAFAQQHFPPELTVRPTGTLILHARTTTDLITGQIESLALTAGIIFVIMSGMFLSTRVGLIAMIPNLFPILVFFGLLGATGAVLSLTTNTIAAIALGIAVDDTIHIMTRLSSEVRATGDQEQALLQALSTVGKPALYAALLVFSGFLVLGFSTFVPIQEFGVLSATTVAVGLVGEIVLLPALLATTRIITLWDLLYLKLGKNPHKTIGIFADLRPSQAKIVALMSELKSFSRGQPIIRQGEAGNAMYVLISGTADVVINSADQPRRVRELKRGDVCGEMGLLRHHERTADVIATEDVEVMAMDERFLSRVQQRYPRIGSKVFLNIAKVLSDRLQEMQQEGSGE
jgi:hypothetical protein